MFERTTSRLTSEECMRAVAEVGINVKYNPINSCVIIMDIWLLKKFLDLW